MKTLPVLLVILLGLVGQVEAGPAYHPTKEPVFTVGNRIGRPIKATVVPGKGVTKPKPVGPEPVKFKPGPPTVVVHGPGKMPVGLY